MPVSRSNERYCWLQRCQSLACSRRWSDRAASERRMPPTISPPMPIAAFRPKFPDRYPRDPRWYRPRYWAFSVSRVSCAASPLRCVNVRLGWAVAGATVSPNAAQLSAAPKSRDACLFIAFSSPRRVGCWEWRSLFVAKAGGSHQGPSGKVGPKVTPIGADSAPPSEPRNVLKSALPYSTAGCASE